MIFFCLYLRHHFCYKPEQPLDAQYKYNPIIKEENIIRRYRNMEISNYFTVPEGSEGMFYHADMLFTVNDGFPTYIAAQCPLRASDMINLIDQVNPKVCHDGDKI